METFKFETRVNEPRKLMEVAEIFNDMPKVDSWHVEPFSDVTLLSIRGINIRALDIIRLLDTHGIQAVRLYEE